MNTTRRISLAGGILLIGIGMILGPDVVGAWFPGDTIITSSALRAYVRMLQLGFILAGLIAAVPAGKVRRAFGIALYLLVVAGVIEAFSAMMLKAKHGQWHFLRSNARNSVFIPHPFLVASPKPDTSCENNGIVISHTPEGYRRTGTTDVANRQRRLVTIGGSTTYCTGVNDNETWPYYLGEYLSNSCEVINLGVPGYSSVEHLIQTAFQVTDLHPARAIFYVGWNDARNYRVADLAPDYSEFHGPSQYTSLLLPTPWMGPDFAVIRILVTVSQKAGG